MSILLRQYIRQLLSETNDTERNLRELIKEFVKSDSEKHDFANIGKHVTKSIKKNKEKHVKRAQRAQSSDAAASILSKHLSPNWVVANKAVVGSGAADLSFVNKDDPEQKPVSVEVKDFGSLTKLKFEISLDQVKGETGGKKSSLATSFGLDSSDLGTSEAAIAKRLPSNIIDDVKAAIDKQDETYIGKTKLIGSNEERHIRVVKGDIGDWSRVRHSSSEKSAARHVGTTSSKDVQSKAKNQLDAEKLVNSIVEDLRSKGDEYLILLSPEGSVIFSLTGSDRLGINAPMFSGEHLDLVNPGREASDGKEKKDPKLYNLETIGGGKRPAVRIKLKKGAGKKL